MINMIGINISPHTAYVNTATESAVNSGMAGLTFQIIKHKKTVNNSNKPYQYNIISHAQFFFTAQSQHSTLYPKSE